MKCCGGGTGFLNLEIFLNPKIGQNRDFSKLSGKFVKIRDELSGLIVIGD
jgi:hypothetical protein